MGIHALDRGRCLLVSVPAVFKSILDESSPCCPLPLSTPPKSVAKPRMVDALERVGTPIDEQSFPKAPCMGKNWAHWVKQWALEMNDLPDGTTGIVDIARDPTKAYAVKMTYDRAPSLTRKNYDLAVFGQPSNSKVGPQGKLMTLRERCGVMGFDVDDFVGHLSLRDRPRQPSVTPLLLTWSVLCSSGQGLTWKRCCASSRGSRRREWSDTGARATT